VVLKDVASFNVEFDERVGVGFIRCWDLLGILIPWTQYNNMLVEAKSKEDSYHEKTTTLKGKIMVNYFALG